MEIACGKKWPSLRAPIIKEVVGDQGLALQQPLFPYRSSTLIFPKIQTAV